MRSSEELLKAAKVTRMKHVAKLVVLVLVTANTPAVAESECARLFENERWEAAQNVCEESADSGNAESQRLLADILREGKEGKEDVQGAIYWYKRAAKQGEVAAHFALAEIYSEGIGVDRDASEALLWSKRAAALGFPLAQLNLGFIYKYGTDTPQNYIRAHMWLNLAAANGDQLAKEERENLASVMTAQQVAEAQQLARECEDQNYQNCD